MRTLMTLALALFGAPAAAQQCIELVESPQPSNFTDSFAGAAAIDGPVLVIGEPGAMVAPPTTARIGLAAVYRQDPASGIPRLEQVLAPLNQAFIGFGQSCAVEGDLIAVGHRRIDPTPAEVFLYRFNGATWEIEGTVSEPPGTASFQFASRVYLADGRLICPDPNATDGTSGGQGAVYIFEMVGGVWTQTQVLDRDGGEFFGSRVAADGDHVAVKSGDDLDIFSFDAGVGAFVREARIPFATSPIGFVADLDFDGDSLALLRSFPTSATEVNFLDRNAGTGAWEFRSGFASPLPFLFQIRFDEPHVVYGPGPGQTGALGFATRTGGGWQLDNLDPNRAIPRGIVGATMPYEPRIQAAALGVQDGRAIVGAGGNVGRLTYVDLACAAAVGVVTCEQPELNSVGLVGQLIARGSTAIGEANLDLRAGNLPMNTFGMVLMSPFAQITADPGNANGHLCIGGAIRRFDRPGEVQDTSNTGSFQLVVDLQNLPQGPLPFAGQRWFFQCWYRDLGASVTSRFSRALQVDLR